MPEADIPSSAPTSGVPSTNPTTREAQERFKYCQEWESVWRKHVEDDHKMANGDAYNQWQWPNGIHKSRDTDERPCLTVNQIKPHNLQIINDAKQNKSAITIRPTAGDASYQSAQIYTALVRHIEYVGDASTAYDIATEHQVETGMGYWYYELDYENDNSFDMMIITKQCPNPGLIFLDPDISQKDGLDAEYGFIFDDVPKKEFNKRYSKYKDRGGQAALGNTDWYTSEMVRVADYYRKIYKEDELFAFADPDNPNVTRTAKRSELGDQLADAVAARPGTRSRKLKRTVVEWNFIIGNEIVDTKIWPGKYIPIIRCVGYEFVVQGIMDRCGHTRSMLDAQRIYNYWSSSAVENVALQSKTPWVGPSEAFEGFEEYWKTANKVNHAFLPYNGFADDGVTPIEAPQRPQPPVMAQAYLDGMKVAQMELMMTSGQYQSQMGEPGNERSAKAITERQRQGDNATYTFIDNRGIAIRAAGKVLIDLIPKVFDTKRTMKILGLDGETMQLTIDPDAQQALQQLAAQDGKIIEHVLNPGMGQYDVVADNGPEYATRRQETFNAMVQVMTQAPQLTPFIADLLMKAADFPEADEAARRLFRVVPPEAKGTGPSPEMQQAQQTIQQLQSLLAAALQDAAGKDLKLKGKDQLRDIDAYDAETRRMAALQKMLPGADPQGLMEIIHGLVSDAMATHLTNVVQSATAGLGQQPTGPGGAKQAADGQWYIPDPKRAGKYMQLIPPGGGGAGGGQQPSA